MFPMTVQLTIANADQLATLSKLLSAPAPAAPKPQAEKTAAPAAKAEPAPGKPTASAAAETAAPEKTAAAPSPTAPSAEAKPPASTVADISYSTLAAAVNAALGKHGKDKLAAIAKKHGADTFKGLSADKWQAAHDDVVALGA